MSADAPLPLEVTEAVKLAKDYVTILYGNAGETITNIGLEEVDRWNQGWRVTLSFNRAAEPGNAGLITQLRSMSRAMKRVTVQGDGSIDSMLNVPAVS